MRRYHGNSPDRHPARAFVNGNARDDPVGSDWLPGRNPLTNSSRVPALTTPALMRVFQRRCRGRSDRLIRSDGLSKAHVHCRMEFSVGTRAVITGSPKATLLVTTLRHVSDSGPVALSCVGWYHEPRVPDQQAAPMGRQGNCPLRIGPAMKVRLSLGENL